MITHWRRVAASIPGLVLGLTALLVIPPLISRRRVETCGQLVDIAN